MPLPLSCPFTRISSFENFFRRTLTFLGSKQCDQMATTTKIWQITCLIYQSIKILPNTKWTLSKWQKCLNIMPKCWNFAKSYFEAISTSSFFKWPSPASFMVYLRLFKKQHYNFYNICEKMSIQYPVPGIEPTTSSPITTWPGLRFIQWFFGLEVYQNILL